MYVVLHMGAKKWAKRTWQNSMLHSDSWTVNSLWRIKSMETFVAKLLPKFAPHLHWSRHASLNLLSLLLFAYLREINWGFHSHVSLASIVFCTQISLFNYTLTYVFMIHSLFIDNDVFGIFSQVCGSREQEIHRPSAGALLCEWPLYRGVLRIKPEDCWEECWGWLHLKPKK